MLAGDTEPGRPMAVYLGAGRKGTQSSSLE